MNGILGKIVEVSSATGADAGRDRHRLEVKFKPAALLPEGGSVPEWLSDQTLTVPRTVLDIREVGAVGDSIVLTAAESEPYLQPLVVEPAVCFDSLPETIHLMLRWAKDEEPEYEAVGGGTMLKGKFAKENDLWSASLSTKALFRESPFAPATVTIKVDKLEATCTLLDSNTPSYARMSLPQGPAYRLENDWYSLDFSLTAGAGAIESFVEKGRGIDHFAKPSDMVHLNHEAAGHLDRVRIGSGWGWFDKLRDTAVSSTGARSEGDALRLTLESPLDDGQNIRTSVVYTLFDRLPMLTLQRDYLKGKASEPDKKDARPKERIDEVATVGLGFRASWITERGATSGSRTLYADKDRLAIVRSAKPNDFLMFPDWKISGGWCLMEHPGRREQMLYFFDTKDAPSLATWAGPRTVTLEPQWPFLPLTPGHSLGVTLGLAAGELCGASAQGAWVACRSVKDSRTRIGIVARLSEPSENATAEVSLGDQSRTAPLAPLYIVGIGTLHSAVVEFDHSAVDAPLTATVAGIPGRSAQAGRRQ